MTDLLQTGSDWLADQLKAHASRSVNYSRGAESIQVDATIGKTEFEIEDDAGVVQRIESRDFLIHAADLQLGGSEALYKPIPKSCY